MAQLAQNDDDGEAKQSQAQHHVGRGCAAIAGQKTLQKGVHWKTVIRLKKIRTTIAYGA